MSTTTPSEPFKYPPYHSFPPFYTLQPVLSTRHAQLLKWSSLILSYCTHHRIYKISLSTILSNPSAGASTSSSPAPSLFSNPRISRHLALPDAKEVITFMIKQGRAEWVNPKKEGDGGGNVCWVYWRTVDEWASVLEGWVDETALRGTVLTLYELVEGEVTLGRDFHGMDLEMLQKVLAVLVKRGKAQVFGQEDGQGVKFF